MRDAIRGAMALRKRLDRLKALRGEALTPPPAMLRLLVTLSTTWPVVVGAMARRAVNRGGTSTANRASRPKPYERGHGPGLTGSKNWEARGGARRGGFLSRFAGLSALYGAATNAQRVGNWRYKRKALFHFSIKNKLLPEFNGAGEGTRTPDPIITNDVLYQLSYTGFFSGHGPRPARTMQSCLSVLPPSCEGGVSGLGCGADKRLAAAARVV